MSDTVSILIPCHNAAPWLAETLSCALSQTWPHLEIIVVDDGSTDGSLEIVRRYETRGVRVIRQPQRGAAAARNAAWAASTGAWLQFLDADDLMAPDKLEIQLACARQSPSRAALCTRWQRFQSFPGDQDPVEEPLCTDLPSTDWVVLKLERHLMMHPAAWLVPREVAEAAGRWDESLTLDDDGEFFARVVLASSGVRCARGTWTFYRSGLAGSLSRSKSDRAWSSAYRSLELTVARLLQAEDSPRTRHAGATAFQRFIYEAYPLARESRRRAKRQVSRLGGSDLEPDGGPRFQLLRRFIGWRLARRLQESRAARGESEP